MVGLAGQPLALHDDANLRDDDARDAGRGGTMQQQAIQMSGVWVMAVNIKQCVYAIATQGAMPPNSPCRRSAELSAVCVRAA